MASIVSYWVHGQITHVVSLRTKSLLHSLYSQQLLLVNYFSYFWNAFSWQLFSTTEDYLLAWSTFVEYWNQCLCLRLHVLCSTERIKLRSVDHFQRAGKTTPANSTLYHFSSPNRLWRLTVIPGRARLPQDTYVALKPE